MTEPRVTRRGLSRALLASVTLFAVITGVFVAGVDTASATERSSASGQSAAEQPAAGQGVSNPDDPGRNSLLRFRLDAEKGGTMFPNAMNFAQHSTRRGPLLVFLPATGARPRDYRSYLKTAVAEGYDVLGLDYWNRGRSVVRTCAGDAACYTAVQHNRLTGTRGGPYSNVDRQNSIMNRLRSALGYLAVNDRAGKWGRYIDDGRIKWGSVVLAGHSQGGGESAYIAHLHRVRGVLMYSSPVEADGTMAAAWMAEPGRTPARRLYGFVDEHDMYYDKIVASWAELGMSGAASPVAAPVPTGSHILVSSIHLGSPYESHGRSVSDETPRGLEGAALYRPTWRWMLGQLR